MAEHYGPRERLLDELSNAMALVTTEMGHEKVVAALERAYSEGYAQGQADSKPAPRPAPRTYEEAVRRAVDEGAHSVDWPPVGEDYRRLAQQGPVALPPATRVYEEP